jgi:hypothetical protein
MIQRRLDLNRTCSGFLGIAHGQKPYSHLVSFFGPILVLIPVLQLLAVSIPTTATLSGSPLLAAIHFSRLSASSVYPLSLFMRSQRYFSTAVCSLPPSIHSQRLFSSSVCSPPASVLLQRLFPPSSLNVGK